MTTPIIKINGIGLRTAEILVENGYKCAEDLAAASVEALSKVHGFGPVRAQLVIETAQALCGGGSESRALSETVVVATETTENPKVDDETKAEDSPALRQLEKKDKANKKSKKSKKKKKDKEGKKAKKEKKQKKDSTVTKSEAKKKKKKKKKKE